ncbi:MAG: MFS transporter [Thiotrichaceae bacterium]|nr:MFS transporter [Thiotrichaceae bacterium]
MNNNYRDFVLYAACYMTSLSYGGVYVLLDYTQVALSGNPMMFGKFLTISGIVTILLVGYSGRLAKSYQANIVAGIGSILCGVGMFGLSFINEVNYIYYIAAFFIGLGWSFYYASSPMIVLSPTISEEDKGKYVSLISVCVVLGTSSLPILHNITSSTIEFRSLFIFSGLMAFIGGISFIYVGILFKLKPSKSTCENIGNNYRPWRTEAMYPFAMVFLGACVFSTMMAFQTSYASERGLSYAVFFAAYSLSVIFSRILFGGVLTKNNPINNLTKILLVMLAGLVLMIINSGYTVIYIISSMLIGISYGLAYPLIKTYSIKVSKPEDRHQVLAFFTLSYFTGVYFFPIVASGLLVNFSSNAYLIALISIVACYMLISISRQKFAKNYFNGV